MKKLTMLAALLLAAAQVWAAVPFQTTTVTADGEFAADTKWYTMQIGNGGNFLTVSAADTPVEVGETLTEFNDADLWCFTGSETDGFKIYNRAGGAGVSLAAPSSPADEQFGANGQTAYARLLAPDAEGFSYLWTLNPSSNITGSYYINIKGNAAAVLNNRDFKLAFWTTGKDHGSSITISPAFTDMNVADNVWTLQTSPRVTLSCEGSTATSANGTVSLGSGDWTFTTPSGKAVSVAVYETADGKQVKLDGYPYYGNDVKIQGPVEIKSMSIFLTDRKTPADHGFALFRFDGTPGFNVVYRIPAITTIDGGEHSGRLVAVNDYRYCGGDIGGGRIDLHMSVSDDNGATWSRPDLMRNAEGKPVSKGTGAPGNVITNLDCGYGDPAIVADRETGELLVVACCGRMNFFSSRRDNPQPSARWWSTDGGKTWSEPDYGQWEQIYALFDNNCKYGYIDGQFIGSGRMVQSRYVKVGDYYRIYAVMSGRNADAGNISNWVLYSDDFGRNWHILGDPLNPAVSSNADEPKCEELPDGSVLLAARANGGNRNFNIFRYTDAAKAEGQWGAHFNTDMGMGRINACNGEIMIVPVRDKATGARHYLALQSFPYGGGRNNVSIAWKALAEPADYDEPSDFATWGGRFQVSTLPSAYSTMCLQHDNKIGFLYEEETFNKVYTEIYIPLSIEEITEDKYEYSADADKEVANRMAAEMMRHRITITPDPEHAYVGTIAGFEGSATESAISAFEVNPSIETIASFNTAIASDIRVIEPEAGAFYHFFSAHDGAYSYNTPRYLSVNKTSKLITTVTKADATKTAFRLVKPEGSEHFLVYNPNSDSYLPVTESRQETTMKTVANASEAGTYRFESDITGHTSIVCTTPGNETYPAFHLKSSGGTVVIWTIEAGGSKWYMEKFDPENFESGIAEVGTDAASVRYFDLQGREVPQPRSGELYITSDHSKVIY